MALSRLRKEWLGKESLWEALASSRHILEGRRPKASSPSLARGIQAWRTAQISSLLLTLCSLLPFCILGPKVQPELPSLASLEKLYWDWGEEKKSSVSWNFSLYFTWLAISREGLHMPGTVPVTPQSRNEETGLSGGRDSMWQGT